MSTNKTPNLNLHSWVETDPVLMSEFNENFNAIDTASQTFGNCKIITGSYVGTGQCGSAYSNRLYFDTAPKWLIITPQPTTSYSLSTLHSSGYLIFNLAAVKLAIENNTSNVNYAYMWPINVNNSSYSIRIMLEDDGNTVVWRTDNNSSDYPDAQANSTSTTYFYTALV